MSKLNILYIDPHSLITHTNYNQLQIDALYEQSDSITFCFRENYDKCLNIKDTSKIIVIPEKFFKNARNGFTSRIMIIFRYLFIFFKVKFKKYDRIIFSYYDEISLSFVPFPKGSFLINHVNLSGIYQSKIKRFFFKCISKRYTHIVMDKYSKSYLSSLHIDNVQIVPHGIIRPFSNLKSTHNKVIFCPSSSSSNHNLVNDMLENDEFISFLKTYGYKLIIKGNYFYKSDDTVTIINSFLSDSEYTDIFVKSTIILLPYSDTFRFRTSGILLEAIANNKMIFVSNIPALVQYHKYYPYIFSFSSIKELIHNLQISSTIISSDIDYDKNQLTPDYSFLNYI